VEYRAVIDAGCVHPSIQWAKFEALAAGAGLASQELWGR
jgi:hypothetical protein